MRHFGMRAAAWLALCTIGGAALADDDTLARMVSIDLEAQPLAPALIEFSRQANVQIIAPGPVVAPHETQGVRGQMPLGDALTQLLAGTPLGFHLVGVNVVGIDAPPASAAPPPALPESPAATPADAVADDGVTQLDKIIVTAGKRAQDIRDYVGSVAALRGDMLEKIGAQSFDDYLKLVPGVTMHKLAADAQAPVIRGIATSSGPIGISARTTGIFIDEIPLSDLFYSTAYIDLNPFDLERVEIMKGPQGTLFGSSAIAGAIRNITNKPELNVWRVKTFANHTAIRQGGNEPSGAVMVNAPLGNSAAVRGVASLQQSPGVVDDLFQGLDDTDRREQAGGRLLASWAPIERLKLAGTYLQQQSEQFGYGFADQRERYERSNTNGGFNRLSRVAVGNLVASYEFDWGTVLSSTSRVDKNNHMYSGSNDRGTGESTTGDGNEGTGAEDSPRALQTSLLAGKLDGIVQELRLTSADDADWRWLGGAAFLRFDERTDASNNNPVLQPGAVPVDPFGSPLFPVSSPAGSVAGWEDAQIAYARYSARATESAAFGEITRLFWDLWEVTLGGRYFETQLDANTLSRGVVQGALAPGTVSAEGHDELRESGFNPKIGTRLLLNENVNLYALVARGFQFGGIQFFPYSLAFDAVTQGQAGPKFAPFKSSTLWNYEVGTKTEWWGGRLQFDATLFHMAWKDLQLAETVAVQGVGAFTLLSNIGKATSRGVELAMRATPVSGLSFQTSGSWVNSVTAVRVANSGLNVPVGTQMPGSARFQMANVASWDRPVPFFHDWQLGTSLTHTYVSRIYTDLSHAKSFGQYSLFDAGLHLLNTTSDWQPDLRLSVNNLLDTPAVAGISTCGSCRNEDIYFVRPRTTTLSLQVRF